MGPGCRSEVESPLGARTAQNLGFIIDVTNEGLAQQAIEVAPRYYVRVASAIRRTIEMIHRFERLHFQRGVTLENVEVYLSRAATTPRYVLARWKSHRKNRGHGFATVLFTCDSRKAARLEGLAINILAKLKLRDALCVAGANVGGRRERQKNCHTQSAAT